MNELATSLRGLLDTLQAQYNQLQQAFDAETDMPKADALDKKLSQIGKDLVSAKSQLMAAETAAQKSSFEPSKLKALAQVVTAHADQTRQAIASYTDSIEQANHLASRVASAMQLAGNILKV